MNGWLKTEYTFSDFIRKDLPASLTIVCLAAPQCIAYAIIAGIPPAMGLYAATIPTMVAALLRSSRLTVTGPTNAISLLVFIGVLALPNESEATVAVTLAFMAGLLQLALYFLRLEHVMSFVSQPVVVGYITGAAVLIGISQLPNITQTVSEGSHIVAQLHSWLMGLHQAHIPSVLVGLTTLILTLLLRRKSKTLPADMMVLLLVTLVVFFLNGDRLGILRVQDLSPISKGLPEVSWPNLEIMVTLGPLAFAIAMLSLVESTSVSRAIASRIGEPIDLRKEVLGQALSNISASFLSGYPTSGSLARSALNEASQAASRLSAFFSGLWMLLIIILFGEAVNHIPLSALGGLLLLIAYRLIRIETIQNILRSTRSDRWSLAVTMLGTWLLPLDQAIYLGMIISVLGFLQRTRQLRSTSIVLDPYGYIQLEDIKERSQAQDCPHIEIIQIEGSLYFAASESLRQAIDNIAKHSSAPNIIVRLRRTQHMDYTIANTLFVAAKNLQKQNRRLIIVGLQEEESHWLHSVDSEQTFCDSVYPTQTRWFNAMHNAIADIACKQDCTNSKCCPLKHHLKDPNAPI